MAKSKSSTKVTARRTAAKGSRKGPVEPAAAVADNAAPAPDRARETKRALVLGLLQRKQGASLAELIAATSWLPHTTRAALTRLRQGGHDLQKEKLSMAAEVSAIVGFQNSRVGGCWLSVISHCFDRALPFREVGRGAWGRAAGL